MLCDRLGETIHRGDAVMQVGNYGAILVVSEIYRDWGEQCMSGYWMDCGELSGCFGEFYPTIINGVAANWELLPNCGARDVS